MTNSTDWLINNLNRPNRTLIIISLLSIMALAFLFQGSRGIWQPDEGYYVGSAVTMIKNNNFLVPKIGTEIFLEKPPVLYWGIIAGIKAFGQTEFACRAFNSICFAVTIVLTGALGYSLFGRKTEAFICALVYATMAVPFTAANFVTMDTPLVLWTTASILFFYKTVKADGKYQNAFRLLFYISLGLGFLTKGPAAIIPCAGMFVYLVWTRQLKKFLLNGWTPLGILLSVAIGLSWYIYISLKIPGAAAYFFDNQIWGRLVSEKYRRNPGITKMLIYVPILLAGSLPWSTIWLEHKKKFKTTVTNKDWWKSLSARPEKLFLLAMFFTPLLILSLASSRLALYCLPLFPLLAAATAKLWTEKLYSLPDDQSRKGLKKTAILLSCWVLILLGSRFGLAHFGNNEKDARALWAELTPYIPKEKYQIVSLDMRIDGLLFYGAQELENITRKDNPYPTFTMPETFTSEIVEMIEEGYIYLFMVEGEDRFNKTLELLKTNFNDIKAVALEHQRWLIIINPKKSS
ncbi:MAG: glycosyltransferase family 39 protein [Phycisphaerae bacterium]|nr:glycosyltransferase family 39 protein [Phycisphaerae bacterium]